MKAYSQFLVAKKPPEVIAEYGFHPELVESEYQRFVRLAEYDIDSLQKKFLLEFRQDLPITSDYTINSFLEKYRKDGKLTIDEFIKFIDSLLNEKYRLGKVSAIDDLLSGTALDGWATALCLNCNKPIPGCMVDATKRSTIMKSDVPIPWTHSYLGMSCVQL